MKILKKFGYNLAFLASVCVIATAVVYCVGLAIVLFGAGNTLGGIGMIIACGVIFAGAMTLMEIVLR